MSCADQSLDGGAIAVRLVFSATLLALASCSGCDGSKNLRERAQSQVSRHEYEEAISTIDELCANFAGSEACSEMRPTIPGLRLAAGRKHLDEHRYHKAQTALERASREPVAEVSKQANELLGTEDLRVGLAYEEAWSLPSDRALTEMEKLEATDTKATPLVKGWLKEHRPGLLLESIRGACNEKSPLPSCGAISGRLFKLHPGTPEVTEAEKLVDKYVRAPLNEGQPLEWQGKLREAALKYDSVCWRGPGSALCKEASGKADAVRLRLATVASMQAHYDEAKEFYDIVAKSAVEDNRKKAQEAIASDALTSGVALEAANRAAAVGKRSALSSMEDIAKKETPAAWTARAWIARERPPLYLEDVQAACQPKLTDDCPTACKKLIDAHPYTTQAGDARKFLASWEGEPIRLADELLKGGKVAEAAAEYDRTCTRAPTSTACLEARAKAADAYLRAAHDAIGVGNWVSAKKLLDPVVASKETLKKQEAERLVASPEFVAGYAHALRTAEFADVKTKCGVAAANCPESVKAFLKGAVGDESKEAGAVLDTYMATLTTTTSALATADGQLGACRELRRVESLRGDCFPGPLAEFSESLPPVDSAIDKLALAAGYAAGGAGAPSPVLARRGLMAMGAILGLCGGAARAFVVRARWGTAVGVVVAGIALIAVALLGTGAFKKVKANYESTGIVE